MFGNIGFPELLVILAIALLVFGPKKLPEVGKSIGKAVREFRRTSDEIKDRIEEEIRVSEFKDIKDDLKKDFSFDQKDFGIGAAETKDAAPATAAPAAPTAVPAPVPEAQPAAEPVAAEAAPDAPGDAAGGSEVKKNGEGQEIS